MARIEEDWHQLAVSLGFKDEKDMKHQLYVMQGFSTHDLARVVGCSHYTVNKRLRDDGIKLRTRGGPVRLGKRKLSKVSDDELFALEVKELAAKYDVHPTSVWKEQRIRRKSWNKYE